MTSQSCLFIGIMSGTSADGIDVALISHDNSQAEKTKLLQFLEFPMPDKLRKDILRLAQPGNDEIDCMGKLHRALGLAYADAVFSSLRQAGLQTSDISAIGCHGQTIRHRPETNPPFSLQIGCAATLAEQTTITIVSDFRSRDIAAGGEGAPLVPFAHRQLFATNQHHRAIVNIGGIANVTWIGSDKFTTGFDIGPGNMMMDQLMLWISNGQQSFDRDGKLAASGLVCAPLLNQLMNHPFIARQPPKSTGREIFGSSIVDQIKSWPNISNADRMATACQFTVDAIVKSITFMPAPPKAWLFCGGGTRNTHLMQLLKKQLLPASVQSTDTQGIPSQAVEAVSFALLARHSLMGEPNCLSQVTGAHRDVCGGQIAPGNNWNKLLLQIPTWTR